MGFLTPLFLLAGLVVLVPIILHLFYRQESKTFTFPAILYLLRTERDHARQIRTQQLLLLLLRTAIVVLLVLLGARMHLPGPGGSHEPTALALVLDNSLSTTIIDDGQRRLDTLKAVARQSVAGANHEDVIWVLRAGTPWEPAVPSGIVQSLAAIDATEPGHTHGDLSSAVARARALVGQSELPNREVHVFTDLQATAFAEVPPTADEVPVVVFGAPAESRGNRGITDISIGDGLAPLAGRRTEAAVSIAGGVPGDTVGVRLYVGGQLRAAATAPVGATVRLPAGPFPPGHVTGYAEIDPDPLTADDRRYFSFSVRDPTPVALLGPAPFFLSEALVVLEESDRISIGGAAGAATLISLGGEGLERRGFSQSAFVIPLADPSRLPALNRRLAEAGIPYRYDLGTLEGARIAAGDFAVDLTQVEVRRYFPMVATAPTPATDDPNQGPVTDNGMLPEDRGAEPPTGALVTLANGDPWLLSGNAATGPYVLLASPLGEQATSLPVSAAMIPLLEWVIEHGARSGSAHREVIAGTGFRPPSTATAVQTPDGAAHAVDGDQPYLGTATSGLYRVFADDSVLQTVPVNPPGLETYLEPASASDVRRAIPGVSAVVEDAAAWSRHIFRAGRGPEPWRVLAVLVLALLVVETVVAASRVLRARRSEGG
ncbi:MAG: hypothetical protein F4123_13195 [Gemmatimonadetes bacterium]|nr:hypothetical protein [Gemmatimonadota bacterium]